MQQPLQGARLLLRGFAFLCASLLPVAAYSQAPLFTFAQISDSQATPGDPSEQAMFEEVLDTIIAGGQAGALIPHPVSFVMFPGDLVDKPLDTGEWTIFNNTIATRLTANGIPYRAVPGNHDWHPSIGFSHYETYVASAAVWQTGSDIVTGHNGPAVATGWRGLHFIGFNNSNGAYNTISAGDLALIDQLAAEASARNENIFLLGHHQHDENSVIPLAQTLGNPDVVGYMRGHHGTPHATSGLSGVSNPNVWDLSSHDINNRGTILYIEVYATQLQVYVIQLVDDPTSLPAPVTIPLVHPMVSAGPPVAPTADFSASPLAGDAPLSVAFTDLSDGAPTAWDWDFGDGSTSTQQSPEHVYAEGSYDVSLTVSNAQGNDALVEYSLISVDPAPPMVTYAAVADAHVRSSQPATNYGTLDYVRVRDDATAYHGYFMFDVSGLGGASVVSATLRLYVQDGSDDGGSLQLANNGWTELGITWNNVPASAYVGELGPAPLDTWLEFDVTAQVPGEGTYSFAVHPNSTNSVFYTSREGANPPELVLVLDDPAPDISVSPLSHDYGLVAVGASANTVVNVANSGSAILMVSGTVLAGNDAAEFDLSGGGAFSLDPGVNQDIQVTFEPVSSGQKNATLQVTSDDPDEPVIDVVLFGLSTVLSPDIAVLPPAIDFGSVDVGLSDAQSVSITNAGSADLNVTGLSLSGLNPGDFGLGGPASFSLPPGASQDVQVDFTPASEGARSASLEIESDDPDEPSVPVSLQGVGVVPGC